MLRKSFKDQRFVLCFFVFSRSNAEKQLKGAIEITHRCISAASCNKWFCEDILGSENYNELQSPITMEMLGRNHVYFLPYLMGERSPINDTYARGTFTGLRMDTTRADMLLAVMEGVAFAIRDNLEIARSQGLDIPYSYLCGGGARSLLWQKIFCNVLNIPIRLPQTEEGPGYGGALLAMVGCGRYKTVQDCIKALVHTKEVIYPDSELAARYEERHQQFRKIYPTMKSLFKELL